MEMKRLSVNVPEKMLKQIDRERGIISRSSYVRAVIDAAKLTNNPTIHKLAREHQKVARENKKRRKRSP
jgi:metal-responsive CopG/Arc/MetJ family transcriptional regulator